jgi:aryl-alcohol dehydrogenase-like predicted oxidoreductase
LKQRVLGRTGQAISEISFGCGNVGGLMIRGDHADQVHAVAHAVELGITYFDTAASYGDGVSEQNLGKVMAELKPDVLVGTKLQLGPSDVAAGTARVREIFQQSLDRLDRDSVDLLYYHGRIRTEADPRSLTPAEMNGPLLEASDSFRREGRVRFLGFTGLGDTEAVLQVIDHGGFDLFHCYFNAVNPSAAYRVPRTFAPQHLGGMMSRAAAKGMGALGIRVLAAGAAAGPVERHALAGGRQGTLISGTDYDADEQRAERLRPIADELGLEPAAMAIRFALSKPELSTALVGFSSLDQIDYAVRAAEAGPLPAAAVQRILDANDDE